MQQVCPGVKDAFEKQQWTYLGRLDRVYDLAKRSKTWNGGGVILFRPWLSFSKRVETGRNHTV